MVSRVGKGKHGMRRFARSLLLILAGVLCLGLFSGDSSAEDEFDAREGEGWNVTTDGVLTIEDNNGWKDYLKHGAYECINKLVIGKRLTKFYLYDDMYEEVEACFQFPDEILGVDVDGTTYYADAACCPVFNTKEIEVEKGNPVFIVEDGLLINQENHTVVLVDADQSALVIPEGITTIGTWAFRRAEVETVQFPSTLKTIGILSFWGCANLVTPDFPASLTSILTDAFANCENVDQVVLPESLRVIGSGAFSSCGIHEIVIPSGIQVLETGTFNECKNLKSVVLPESIKRIENTVFRGCTSLSEISLPEGLEYIGAEAFKGCENLTITSLPEGLSYIGEEAFYGCNMGESLKLPASLQEIGEDAFKDMQFFLVEFPESLKLNESAFDRIHVAVFPGSDYEFAYGSINLVDNLLFLNTPPRGIQKDNIIARHPLVFYTEEYADAWKPIAANGLNGWPTSCISLEEANTRIAQAAVPTPEPTRTPETTTEVLGMHISTPEPYTPPDQPAEDTKTDPLIYVFAGLLVLVAAGIVVIGIKTRKKHRANPHHAAKPD